MYNINNLNRQQLTVQYQHPTQAAVDCKLSATYTDSRRFKISATYTESSWL